MKPTVVVVVVGTVVVVVLVILIVAVVAKSLYRSVAGRHFYGTENVIWTGFGPIGNTEKKLGRLRGGRVFHVFMGKNNV